ncbi:DUF7604 domain-containing protein [Bifidobacterium porcinum]|uniref:DUF7604 domain-containing protein n=1 Tax=Bifidobacterium porcinum TaxID=212365 RepID=UPI0006946127|nr:FctA domain-containing protein [Bifidobacterium porcinum]
MTGGIGYAVASTATADGTTGDLTVQPSISKYVNKIAGGDGDQYELHLTASGDTASSSTTTATPADIVIVADKSGSMEGDRDTNSQNAVDALAEKLLTAQNEGLPENQQIRMAVVTFSTKARLQQGFTTDAQNITTAMTQEPDGGTNWEAALAQANRLDGRQGVNKYIIFLSDGDPTYRTTSFGVCYFYDRRGNERQLPGYSTKASCTARGYGYWWQRMDDDAPDTPSGVHGNGRKDEHELNYKAAVTEANKRGDAALYVVRTSASAEAKKMPDFAKDAHAETGKEYDGTDAKNLTDAFNAIYTSITSTATVNVFSISDTLSKWVDPVDFAEKPSGSDITPYVTARNGDAELTGYQAVYNVDSSSGSRTVTVTFNGITGITAGKSDHIDISFKIKPSDIAYSDYAHDYAQKMASKKTYPNVGEAGTGQTSAGKQGYYSNDDAQMSYCALLNVDGTTRCEPTQIKYLHPVVQVRLGSIVITKHWSDGADKHAKDPVTVQLQRSAKGEPAENVGDQITLNQDNNWTAQVDGLLPGYTYTVVETSNHDRYAVTYQYGGDSSANGAELTKQMVWGNSGILRADITNTLETASLSKEAIKVKKVIDGRDWRDSDKFKFTLTPKDPNTPTPMPAGCASKEPCTVTVDSNSPDHTKAFGNITYEAGDHDYHYYVTEQSEAVPAMHYSQARYEIVVHVGNTGNTGGTWTAQVSSIKQLTDDNGNKPSQSGTNAPMPMTFTNKYTAVASLPLTGGATARTWLLTSGSLGVLALLLLVGLAVQKRETSLV